MTLRLFGAMAIICACGILGFSLAKNYKIQEQCFYHLQRVITYMSSELTYRSPYLPELCMDASRLVSGCVKEVFSTLSEKLIEGECSDASSAMEITLQITKDLSPQLKTILSLLGQCLGKFDMDGQKNELQIISQKCSIILDEMRLNRSNRIRNYRILGLCAGLALAILLI